MRASLLRAAKAESTVEDVELNPPGPGEVRVRIEATGVCHSDLSIQNGNIPGFFPTVLGHEGAGVISEVGDGVTNVAVGDHVIIAWIQPCRECWFCLHGRAANCVKSTARAISGAYGACNGEAVYPGMGTATFAEETVVPAPMAVKINPEFDLRLGALIGCGVATGVGAVRNAARVQSGESTVVVGCGGVGLAAIQGARLAGAAPLVAIDVVPAKLEMARQAGATDVIDARDSDVAKAVRKLTGGRGADQVLEVVGSSATIRQAYDLARVGGTVTVVGAGRFDDPVQFNAMELMLGSKRLQGTVYGDTDPARDFPELVDLSLRGLLDLEMLVSRTGTLADIDAAYEAMRNGEVARTVVLPHA
ncbi:MAG: Zn-dependent alcohol dehydrogenase [Acidimicrobiia bacterium]